jgi:hypothetical protein
MARRAAARRQHRPVPVVEDEPRHELAQPVQGVGQDRVRRGGPEQVVGLDIQVARMKKVCPHGVVIFTIFP